VSTRPTLRDALFPGASLMDDEETEAVARVMRSGSLFRYYGLETPNEVADYEEEWAAHIGVRHALAVNSGTSALFCALVAAGVEHGDEVIVPAFAWASVPNAVLQVGALPVVVDVDESLTLDPEAVQRHIGPRTAAILPVHMRGAPSAMHELVAVAADAGVPIVEDACQAAGVTAGGRPVGSFGRVGAVSTQYAKLVSTGEGGVVLTDDPEAYVAALDAHDPANAIRRGEEPSTYPGLNLRCTEIQAAIGRVQLRRLGSLVERTRAQSARVVEAIGQIPELTLRRTRDGDRSNGIAVIFFAPSSAGAQVMRDGLRSRGVSAICLYEEGVVDLHVSRFWRPTEAALAAQNRQAPDCTASLDLLARAVQIDLHPLYDDADVTAICEALEHAASSL